MIETRDRGFDVKFHPLTPRPRHVGDGVAGESDFGDFEHNQSGELNFNRRETQLFSESNLAFGRKIAIQLPQAAMHYEVDFDGSDLTQLNKQLAQAKTLLRQMSHTVEDIEDAKTIERAKLANGSKPRIPWSQVKRELQLD